MRGGRGRKKGGGRGRKERRKREGIKGRQESRSCFHNFLKLRSTSLVSRVTVSIQFLLSLWWVGLRAHVDQPNMHFLTLHVTEFRQSTFPDCRSSRPQIRLLLVHTLVKSAIRSKNATKKSLVIRRKINTAHIAW